MPNPDRARGLPLDGTRAPGSRGWVPAVQGGYVPTTSQAAPTPPTGGSGVKPADPKRP